MNANELANYWMNRKFAIEMADETADMLRQQQTEIEALKKEKGHIRACPNSDDANSFARVSQFIIAKTLTDEEIIKTMVQFDVYSADDQCLIEAGRAILRKAQEK